MELRESSMETCRLKTQAFYPQTRPAQGFALAQPAHGTKITKIIN